MSSPDSEMRIAVARTMTREIMNAAPRIISRLADKGIGDIREDELLVFAVTRMSPPGHAAELARELEVSEQTLEKGTENLIERGYLQSRTHPDDPGRRSIGVTKKGGELNAEMEAAARYVRWADFGLRQGDIIISTHPKSGTTWLQMICALLILRTPDLPRPLRELSPTLDVPDVPGFGQDAFATLAEQRHRRFLKTHQPLSAIPSDPRGTYICIARHPLDVMASRLHLMEVTKKEMMDKDPHGQREGASKPRGGHMPDGQHVPGGQDVAAGQHVSRDPHEFLLQWIDKECPPGKSVQSLEYLLRFVADAWARRDDPNVVLLHYEDLGVDLEGQMRGLAARLGIAVPEDVWPALVKAATFEEMRGAADKTSPLEHATDQRNFFWGGKSGAGRGLLTGTELEHYYNRAAELAPPDMLAWLHR